MGLAGPLEQPGPSLAHTDPIGPFRPWPSLAHLHLDNVDINFFWLIPTQLIYSDNPGLYCPTWTPLVHWTTPAFAGHIGPAAGSPLEQPGPSLAHADPVGPLALG